MPAIALLRLAGRQLDSILGLDSLSVAHIAGKPMVPPHLTVVSDVIILALGACGADRESSLLGVWAASGGQTSKINDSRSAPKPRTTGKLSLSIGRCSTSAVALDVNLRLASLVVLASCEVAPDRVHLDRPGIPEFLSFSVDLFGLPAVFVIGVSMGYA